MPVCLRKGSSTCKGNRKAYCQYTYGYTAVRLWKYHSTEAGILRCNNAVLTARTVSASGIPVIMLLIGIETEMRKAQILQNSLNRSDIFWRT